MQFSKLALTALLLVFFTACQARSVPGIEQKYKVSEQSARLELEQHLANLLTSDNRSGTQQEPGSHFVESIYHAQTLALQHSHRIAGIFSELGIHQAETVQKRMLQNPGIEFSLMRPEDGGRWQLEFSVSLGLLDWLSRQQRIHLADSEIAKWQMQAWQLLNYELRAIRNLWLEAVTAQQKLSIQRDLFNSANTSAEFAGLLHEAGNISELDLLSNQSIADQRLTQMAEAEMIAENAINNLQHALGLQDSEIFSVPDRLPEISDTDKRVSAMDLQALLQLAQYHSPSAGLLAQEIRESEDALRLAMRQRSLRNAGAELITERESNGEHQHGLALSLSAPLFDNGDNELSIVYGEFQRKLIQQQELMSATENRIRTSLSGMQYSLTRLQQIESDELPRFQRMMNLAVAEYNFMLRGTFDLLTIAEMTLNARIRQVDTKLQYWQAYSELESILGISLRETEHDQ